MQVHVAISEMFIALIIDSKKMMGEGRAGYPTIICKKDQYTLIEQSSTLKDQSHFISY